MLVDCRVLAQSCSTQVCSLQAHRLTHTIFTMVLWKGPSVKPSSASPPPIPLFLLLSFSLVPFLSLSSALLCFLLFLPLLLLGKTAAFMLPVLERLIYKPKQAAVTRVLVLVPTRELGIQVHAVARQLAQFTSITTCLAVGEWENRTTWSKMAHDFRAIWPTSVISSLVVWSWLAAVVQHPILLPDHSSWLFGAN